MPAQAVLVAPHKNEHPAVLPFQRKLADSLASQGIKVEEKTIEDSSDRALTLHKLQQKGGELELFGCAQLLFLEDRLIRARLLSTLGNKSTFVLETHAMREPEENTAFPFHKDYQRIHGTKILVGKPVQSVWETIREAFEAPRTFPFAQEDLLRVMAKAAEARGFTLKAAREELLDLANRLTPLRNVFRFIELPAKSVPIPKTSPFHNLQREANAYEEFYCTHTLQAIVNDSEVQKVTAIIRIPEISQPKRSIS